MSCAVANTLAAMLVRRFDAEAFLALFMERMIELARRNPVPS